MEKIMVDNQLSESSQKMMDSVQSSNKLTKAQKVRIGHTIKDGDKAVKGFAAAIDGKAQETEGTTVAGQRLKSFIERIERLEEEKNALSDDIKEVFAEAKGVGFDVKIMRKLLRLRKMDQEKRAEEQSLLETYAVAIGMQYTLAV
jgi:uncharacterized protein (UPF0335 family)